MMNKLLHGIEFVLPDIRWHMPNRPDPRLDMEENYCNNQIPAVGDDVWIRVWHYDEMANSPFWAFYEHWTTYENGMDDKPDDLDLIRLVHCEKISSYENDDSQLKSDKSAAGLFQVRCLEVIELAQIPQRFLSSKKPIIIDLDEDFGMGSRAPKISIFKRPEITFYTGATEGNFWCIVATNAKPRRLILSGGILVGKHD